MKLPRQRIPRIRTGEMKLKNRKTPMRKCVGCMQSRPQKSMIRIACYEGELTVDPAGKAKGRGIYICPDAECMEKARKKNAIQRSFGTDIPQERVDEIFRELEGYEQKSE